jgi:phosphatidylserine decarboxylase
MFAKDGYSVIGWALALSVLMVAGGYALGGFWAWLLFAMALFTTCFTLYFFRDPDRTPPQDADQLLIAPADGKVILLEQGKNHPFFDTTCTQISIFLSPLDVHVNRIPATGLITYAKYHPGKYLVAWHEKASELNERSEFGILHPSGTPVYFRQITGYVARRITYHIKEGDRVTAGDRFGMMKFGSRMDILVPDSMELKVTAGDVTVAGESVMGVFK